VVVDGTKTGIGNDKPTFLLCKELLEIENSIGSEFTYLSWKNSEYNIRASAGYISRTGSPFILLEKMENKGKKDSLILVRELILQYNGGVDRNLGSLGLWFAAQMAEFEIQTIHYISGTDADTILSSDAADLMIRKVDVN
jgi:hypothetical protein